MAMSGDHFGFMDSSSALGMLDTIGFRQALELEGGQLAGLIGAMDQDQVMRLGGEQLFDAAMAMDGDHFGFMDSDSAFSMFDTMGLDRALDLQGSQLAGLMGAMDPGWFDDVGKDQVFEVFNVMGFDQALGMGGDNLAGIFGAMDRDQVAGFEGELLFDAAKAMSGENFGFMDPDSARRECWTPWGLMEHWTCEVTSWQAWLGHWTSINLRS